MRVIRLLIPALAALALAGGPAGRPARAQEQEGPPRLSVRGQGVVTAQPDVAFLTLGASVRRETAGAAFGRTEQLIAALTDSLRANGVAERDIQTRQFNLSPEFGRPQGNEPAPLLGWRATHTVTVKLRDFARIGTTIDDAVAALDGEAIVQGISFTIEDTNALASQARAEAIRAARTRAEEMAGQAGVRLVRILSIQETSAPPPTPVRAAAPQVAGVAAAPALAAEISPGEQTITVTVEVVYEIQ